MNEPANLVAALGADIGNIEGLRWTSTSTDPGPLGQGDATTLKWSIMPDGAEISGALNNEPTSPSNLHARLDSLYGSIDTWLPLFQQVFDRWESLSGIDFVFEPNDDGSPLSQINVGQPGVRGDIRIGGHFIDGDASTLAYNYFPSFGGDMVIDTADNFLDDLSNNSRVLRTIVAHEAGHGVGQQHTIPIVHQKLMEPNINLAFDGPQHDDVLRIQRGYGDRYERNGGNDTAATATAIGGLTSQAFVLGQATITPYDDSDVDDYVGIDDDSDVDFYRFSLSGAATVNILVNPVGTRYGVAIQGSPNSPLFDSDLQSDLSLVVLNADGTTVRANANATGLGGSESVVGLNLPAGQYFIRISGAQDAAQLYKLTASSNLPPAEINGSLWNDLDADGTRDAGEADLADWTVFLDTNSNGILNAGEVSTITLATGDYSFTGLAAGSYTVAIVLQSGWEQTFPAPTGGGTGPRTHTVTVTAGQIVDDINFGNRLKPPLPGDPPAPPVLAAIGNKTMPASQDTLELTLAATDPNGDPLTFTAAGQSIEYKLDQTLGLQSSGNNDWLNYLGRNEKWVIGNNQTWYFILPDGRLFRWLNDGNTVDDPLVESLSPATYTNLALLHSAQPNNAPATFSVNGAMLVINPNSGFVGKFVVTVTVSDGALSDSEEFQVTVQPGTSDTTPPTVTARTPASGATITTSSTNIDITFSEPVTGVDLTDLVLSGAGAASAAKAAPVNTSGNTWRFAVSNLQNGPVNVSLAPDANDIEDAAGNDLAPTSWSFTVNVSVPDTTPPTVTARTPANGATITTSSTNIDVTFSEPVTGVDVTDLVLSGAGAASAVKAAPVNTSGNTWRFAVSNLQNGPVNVSLAPDANDIEDAAGNDLAPASWSFTVSLSGAQLPPVLAPIGNQTMPVTQDTLSLTLSATDPNNDPLTFTAKAQSVEYHLDQTLSLNTVGGNDYLNWGGRNEKWVISGSGTYYYILPDGRFFRWLGGSLASDPLVEQLSAATYATLARLHSAQPDNAPASLSVNGSTLVINPNSGFVGKFFVTATVSDGALIDSEEFQVTVQSDASDTTPPTVTNRTPAAGATITTAATNIDITFSEPVNGVDVTDLVLGGAGAAGAVKAAPVNMGGNVWRFAVTGLQNGPVNVSLAPDAGDIEDAAGNDLAPASWSFTVSLATTQSPPVLAPIGNQTMSSSQDTITLNLSATDPDNDPLTFSATAQSIEYHLDQTLGLAGVGGNEYFNYGGFNEKWLTSANHTDYYITPDGKLYRWLGGPLANDPLVEQVSVAAYTNTALLHSAQPNNAPATVSVNGNALVINPNTGFKGKFVVTVTVSDGHGNTDSELFRVNVT